MTLLALVTGCYFCLRLFRISGRAGALSPCKEKAVLLPCRKGAIATWHYDQKGSGHLDLHIKIWLQCHSYLHCIQGFDEVQGRGEIFLTGWPTLVRMLRICFCAKLKQLLSEIFLTVRPDMQVIFLLIHSPQNQFCTSSQACSSQMAFRNVETLTVFYIWKK